MKQSICLSCIHYGKVEDPLFPTKIICLHFGRQLTGQTITQCNHFKEAEE